MSARAKLCFALHVTLCTLAVPFSGSRLQDHTFHLSPRSCVCDGDGDGRCQRGVPGSTRAARNRQQFLAGEAESDREINNDAAAQIPGMVWLRTAVAKVMLIPTPAHLSQLSICQHVLPILPRYSSACVFTPGQDKLHLQGHQRGGLLGFASIHLPRVGTGACTTGADSLFWRLAAI